MFSILILGVGLIAVAGLFPIAGTMQKSTVDQVAGIQVARNAQAMISVRKFSRAYLTNTTSSGTVDQATNTVQFLADWPMEDRSFPSTKPTTPLNERDYYWVPLFRRDQTILDTTKGWRVYVIVLRRNTGQTVVDSNLANDVNAGTVAGDLVVYSFLTHAEPRAVTLTDDQPAAVPATEIRWHPTGSTTVRTTEQFFILGDEAFRP